MADNKGNRAVTLVVLIAAALAACGLFYELHQQTTPHLAPAMASSPGRQ